MNTTRTARIIPAGFLAAAIFVAGCAGEMTDTAAGTGQPVSPRFVSQDQARLLATQYRRQASDLRDLAVRAEWEAGWYESHFGMSDQEAGRRREQAHQLRAAAEQADQLAIDYRRQVPHGQIQ